MTQSASAVIPSHCFVCGKETEIRMQKEGKALYCTNPNCQAQQIKSLSHFVSRDAMNIEGLSEETLKKFVEKGFVEYYVDLFYIAQYENEMKEMEGFGEKSYGNLIHSIEKAKEVPMANFIYSLGINQVGLSNAKLLCRHFMYDFETILNASEEELTEVDGFGEVIAHSIYEYFHDEKNLYLLHQALEILHISVPEQSQYKQEALLFSGKSFVITGDLVHFKNRKALQEKIEELGGKVTGSVTKKTTYLINNDAFSESSKNKKAKELNIPILSEEQLIKELIDKEIDS